MNVPIGEYYPLTAAAGVVETAPAAGAEFLQVVIGGAATSAWLAVFVLLGLRHRAGKSTLLARSGAALGRATGLPGWVILPYVIAITAFAVAGVGFVWDVALHIDDGRDAGPFANPSHYMLIVSMTLLVTAGWLTVAMPLGDEAGPSGIRVARNWLAPAGGVAMLACAILALSGFALDDVWHRIFGQDVTLWGPTHLMMITGGMLVFFATMVLMREGVLTAARQRHAAGVAPRAKRSSRGPAAIIGNALLTGGALTGLTLAYQQEFGFGVPQFNLLFHPVLIAMSAGMVLISARVAFGRGGALLACTGALTVQGLLTLIGGPLFGELTLHFPLYIADAVMVELAAFALLKRGTYSFAVGAGVLIGTLGTAAEWGWSHVWMPIPWPAHVMPLAFVLSTAVAIGAAAIGAFFAATLRTTPGRQPVARRAWAPPVAGMVVIGAIFVALLPTTAPPGATASVRLTDVTGGENRTVLATVRYSPAEITRRPDWLQAFAWQGNDKAMSFPMRRIGDGIWRTPRPLPVHGTWKVGIRLHDGRTMATVPVYFPADEALGLPVLPAPARFERALVRDMELMQRERIDGVPDWAFSLGSSIVAALTVMMMLFLGWSMLRVARGGSAGTPTPGEREAMQPIVS